eukprot:PITA_25832
MGRSPSCCCWRCSKHEKGLNLGAWTASEDRILSEYIKIHGAGQWRSLSIKAGLKRCGRSCRLRWLNYLRPEIKHGNISPDEEDLLIRLHRLLGNRWELIAGRLPGRTGNEIKNYWNTQMSKKVRLHDMEPKFHNHLKGRDMDSYSNYDQGGVVNKDICTCQNTPINTAAVRYSRRVATNVCNVDSYDYDKVPDTHDGINPEERLKVEDDRVVEIDTSKSWCQILLEDCMGDSQYVRWEAVDELQQSSNIRTSNATDDPHNSTSPSVSRGIISTENYSSRNLFDHEFSHTKDFTFSYLDSFLDLNEPSFVIS